MGRWLTVLLLVLAACRAQDPGPAMPRQAERIVSLDYCADQFVLKFAEPGRIAGVSPGASGDWSYMRDAAKGIPAVRPSAEDVLLMKPDLVVRSYGGGPGAAEFFRRAGIPVLQLGWPSTLAGIEEETSRIAAALGNPEEGEAVAQAMRAKLARLGGGTDGQQTALYLTPSGTTTGPGSLVHEIVTAGGLANFEDRPGWHSLDLERLAHETPDITVAGFFDTEDDFKGAWSTMRHPIGQDQLTERPVVHLSGAELTCGGWFMADAALKVAEAAR